jgi:catechol 2,3-dioxygenase-like lactoylglutathione lyase family enzyme
MSHLGQITLLVQDYDDAIAYFVGSLGFTLVADNDMGKGKRWVVVAPDAQAQTGILLARAADAAQLAATGAQAAGRVAFFLHTDDFARDYARMQAAGVTFCEEPRHEAYGSVVVFEDISGNRWDLMQPNPAQPHPTPRTPTSRSPR